MGCGILVFVRAASQQRGRAARAARAAARRRRSRAERRRVSLPAACVPCLQRKAPDRRVAAQQRCSARALPCVPRSAPWWGWGRGHIYSFRIYGARLPKAWRRGCGRGAPGVAWERALAGQQAWVLGACWAAGTSTVGVWLGWMARLTGSSGSSGSTRAFRRCAHGRLTDSQKCGAGCKLGHCSLVTRLRSGVNMLRHGPVAPDSGTAAVKRATAFAWHVCMALVRVSTQCMVPGYPPP